MPSFPSGALLATPANAVARSIGTIQLNDRINTFMDHDMLPFVRNHAYETVPGSDGAIIRTRRDRKAAQPVLYGKWRDGNGQMFADFLYALEQIDAARLVLGDGYAYAQADVVDCLPTVLGISGRDAATGRLLKWYSWSIKFQCYSAVRVPA